ncbi:uncharacterized protein [Gossypium hirsutum]|uniref:CCHC-type domain-containing protein n=1 Tax=Gossypium hirsutum TaxID=3635 RepID=A0ABM2YLC4_GOSHI|nr:uncharacterized protein LOC121203770 [Gossypium hirsutum]
MGKPFQSQAKKFKEMNTRSNVSSVNFQRDRGRQYSGSKAQATSMASTGSVKPTRPECQHCGKRHLGECYLISRACFKCGSQDHFVKDCPEREEIEKFQNVRSSSVTTRGRPQRNVGIGTSGRGVTKDTTGRFEVGAPAKAYAIRAREEASSPDVITELKARPLFLQEICEAQKVDNELQRRKTQCAVDNNSDFQIDSDGCLMFRDRICVPKNVDLIQKILQEAHDSHLAVHLGSPAFKAVRGKRTSEKIVWLKVGNNERPLSRKHKYEFG